MLVLRPFFDTVTVTSTLMLSGASLAKSSSPSVVHSNLASAFPAPNDLQGDPLGSVESASLEITEELAAIAD
jgi:hypothetical protein